jgi:mannose-binding lectin 2
MSGHSAPRGSALACACVLSLLSSPALALWAEHTFTPPFATFDSDGMRKIDGWRFGGTAEANENFLRLTPDRQSKRGYVWNSARLDAEKGASWTATLRFRTSGQGKRLFGDGIAFWATAHAAHKDGPLIGFTDTFKGFGIVLDTFVNSEPGHVHKDVQIVSSDASAPRKLDDKPLGCDADFRYWEGRDDFKVTNHSALRVRFANDAVSVWIDARGSGAWVPCIMDAPVSAPAGWFRDGLWLGLTASTGDLADNHDVLSVQVGAEDEAAAPPASMAGVAAVVTPEFRGTGDPRIDDAIRSAAAAESALLQDKLTVVQHGLEHQLSSISDSLKAALKKLQDSETEAEKRIEEIERRIGQKVEDKLTASVGKAMDQKLAQAVDQKLSRVEGMVTDAVKSGVDAKIRAEMPGMEKKAAAAAEAAGKVAGAGAAAGGGSTVLLTWLVAALGLVVVIFGVIGYREYRRMLKMHLL